ncbi:MAG: CDC27 family protein [Opitutaceae bacterium]|jgi:tetratricopeptide (TPR) repeat protein
MCKSAPSFYSFSRGLLLAAVFSACLVPARAQDEKKPHAELSDDVREKLQELQPLEAAVPPRWDEALALVNSILPTVGPSSFDRAVISQIKANYLFKEKKPLEAIEPLETAITLSEAYNYFDAKATENLRFYLANLYYERGATSDKDNHEAQQADYAKARTFIEGWLQIYKSNPAARPSTSDTLTNAEVFYASLLFTTAEADPHHIDLSLVRKALNEIDAGLHSIARPPENYYVIKLAALQRLGDYSAAADVLEHILTTKADNKSYWQQLVAFYMTMGANATKVRDDQKAREYNIRAIISLERAQQHGALMTPEDNYTLVGLYFNVGQYAQAAELLSNGLHNDTIKSSPQNWILLANTYQELHRQMKAVETLREASQLFPTSGQFDYLAAQILYDLDKTSDALVAIQSCVAKDGGKQPGQSWLFLSYLAYELQNFELTKTAAENAVKYPDVDTHKAESLRDAAKSALQHREASLHNLN